MSNEPKDVKAVPANVTVKAVAVYDGPTINAGNNGPPPDAQAVIQTSPAPPAKKGD